MAKPSALRRVGSAVCCGDRLSLTPSFTVRSLRMKALANFARLCAVCFILYELVLGRNYVAYEKPVATFNSWIYLNDDLSPISDPVDRAAFCADTAALDAKYGIPRGLLPEALSGGYRTENLSCREFEPATDTHIGPTSVTFGTSESIETLSDNAMKSYVVHGADNASFNLIHSFNVASRASTVTNPPTVVRDLAGNVVASFPRDSRVFGLRVKDMLTWAGRPNALEHIQQDAVNTQPLYLRSTGAVLIARFLYTNERPGEWPWPRALCRTLTGPERFLAPRVH